MGESAISVAVRSRPLLRNESAPPQPLNFDGRTVTAQNKYFSFDFAFPAYVSNEAVYNAVVAQKIHNIFEGYNVTILAYGSTGSGKTYTMGTDYNPKNNNNRDIGIIPQGLNEIFRILESEKDVKSYSVKVSFFELYREDIYDLCRPNANVLKLQKKYGPRIVEDKDGSFKVKNLTEKSVTNIEEAFSILLKGSNIRHTSATAKNSKSSRSHAIFTVYIEQTDKTTLDTKKAKFQLVDLAGSERMDTSKTTGIQLLEGIKINLSLLTLSKVISALSSGIVQHIPYRESKLTRLLQDSLGGNSHTVMIACVNPSSTSVEETLSTLRYANNTRSIKNRPVANIDPPAIQIEKLKKQVESLQAELYKMQPLNYLNIDSSSNSDAKAVELLETAYARINSLDQKLTEFVEKDGFIKERIIYFYEVIKVIVAEMTSAAAADIGLKIHLDKLEEIQSECLQLAMQGNMIDSIENAENCSETSDTAEEYESCESVLPMDVEAELADFAYEQFTPIKSEEELQEELNGAAEKHKSSSKILENVDMRIQMKEDVHRYMQYLCENHVTAVEEEKVDTLVSNIQLLVKQKTDLEEIMQKEKKCLQENHDTISKYEEEIKKLQSELRVVKKSLQMKVESKAKVQTLQNEIQELKRFRVNVLKQVRESSNVHMRLQRKKDQDIAKLERESRKKDFEITKLKTKFSNQVRVLETKVSQATVSKKALLQALQKKKPRQTGVKPMQSQGCLEEWIEEELKISVCNSLVKAQLETLEKDADLLKEQIKKIEKLSPSVENKDSDADELKGELQVQLVQITNMRNQNKDIDQRAKSCIILDGITELSEAKSVIEYLYNKCATAEVEISKQQQISNENVRKLQAINEASFEKVEKLSNGVKILQDEKAQLKMEHEDQIASIIFKHEAEMLEYMTNFETVTPSSMPETADPNLSKRMEPQELEIEKIKSLQEMYEKKCAEVDQLQEELFKVKKGKRSNWLSNLTTGPENPENKSSKKSPDRSMMEEYLSSESEVSFSNDRSDPDWVWTPLQKQQIKRRRIDKETEPQTIEKIADSEFSESLGSMDTSETDSASNLKDLKPNLPCTCEGNCKTMRCKCKKRQVKCTEVCSCSTSKCLNIMDLST